MTTFFNKSCRAGLLTAGLVFGLALSPATILAQTTAAASETDLKSVPQPQIQPQAATQSQPEAVSQRYPSGMWSAQGCGEEAEVTYFGNTLSFYITLDLFLVENIQYNAVPGQGPLVSRVTFEQQDEPYEVLVRTQDDEVTLFYPNWSEDDADADSMNRLMRTGQLDMDDKTLFDAVGHERCPSLPLPHAIGFGEAADVLISLDRVLLRCVSVQACLRAGYRTFDLAGDDGLSIAELSRLARVLAIIGQGASSDDETGMEAALATKLAALPVGPMMASALMHSFDYDRSGTLSFEEVAQSWLPEILVSGDDSMAITLLDVLGGLGSGVQELAEEAENFLP